VIFALAKDTSEMNAHMSGVHIFQIAFKLSTRSLLCWLDATHVEVNYTGGWTAILGQEMSRSSLMHFPRKRQTATFSTHSKPEPTLV
jgi:hypothetical protein